MHRPAKSIPAAAVSKDGLRIALPALAIRTVVVVAKRAISPVCGAVETRGGWATIVGNAVKGEHDRWPVCCGSLDRLDRVVDISTVEVGSGV